MRNGIWFKNLLKLFQAIDFKIDDVSRFLRRWKNHNTAISTHIYVRVFQNYIKTIDFEINMFIPFSKGI